MSKQEKIALKMSEWAERRDFSRGTLERAMKRAIQSGEKEVFIGTSQGRECYLEVEGKKTTTTTKGKTDA